MDCELIIKRLRQHLGAKNDAEVGAYFGISPAAVSAWRSRNRMDLQMIVDKIGVVDLNWLVYGEEKQQLVVPVRTSNDTSVLQEQLAFYKQQYEKKCDECDAANARLDKLLDKIDCLSTGLKRSVSMLNEAGANTYMEGK